MQRNYVRVLDLDTGHQRTVVDTEVRHGHYKVLTDQPALDPRTGEPAAPILGDGKPVAQDEPTSSYKGRKKVDLESEVATRNAQRAAEDHIEVAGNGTVPELIAALEADDEKQLSSHDPGGDAGSEEE